MGTDMRWLHSGAGFKATLNAALPVNGEIMFDRKNQMLEYKYNTTEEVFNIINYLQNICNISELQFKNNTCDKIFLGI